jgi:hypothetical protein
MRVHILLLDRQNLQHFRRSGHQPRGNADRPRFHQPRR